MISFFHKIIEINTRNPGYPAFLAAIVSMVILPVHNQYLPPLMIIWLLVWVFEFISRKGRLIEDENKPVLLLCCFISLFVYLLIGLIYSDNQELGTLLIFRRLSLAIFPIVLFSPGLEIKHKINTLLKAFTLGTITFLLVCFCYALFRSIIIKNGQWTFNPVSPEESWINYFYGSELTLDQHPSYIAMYTVLSMFIALELFSNKTLKVGIRALWLVTGIFLFVSIYFLSSRAGFIAVLLVLPVYLIIKIGKKRLNIISIGLILFIIVCITSFYLFNQRVNFYSDKSLTFKLDTTIINDNRIGIWKSAVKVIEMNPIFGVGIGDSCDELKKEFKLLGYTNGYYDNLNAHNQYLEYLLSSGVLGLLIFLAIIGLMIYSAIKDRNLLFGVFIIIMLIFFTFESMLNRLAGISFFSLFSFLLMHFKYPISLPMELR
jgi:O-antigen ligase